MRDGRPHAHDRAAGGGHTQTTAPAATTTAPVTAATNTSALTAATNTAAPAAALAPGPGDGQVKLAALYHMSRDPFYRSPGGAVPAGTVVHLRLKAGGGRSDRGQRARLG